MTRLALLHDLRLRFGSSRWSCLVAAVYNCELSRRNRFRGFQLHASYGPNGLASLLW